MHPSARNRILCFRIAIKDDPTLLEGMRLEPMQRHYHARHGNDFLFAADYNLPRLQEHFKGQSIELIDVAVHKSEPYVAIKKALGAFSDALSQRTSLRLEFFRQQGVSGRLYRAFANNYFKLMPGNRYLELGAHDGCAFVSSLHGNSIHALAVDDWASKPAARTSFISNLMCVYAPASRFGMLDKSLGKLFASSLRPRTAIFSQGGFVPSPGLLDDLLEATPSMPAYLAVDGWNFAPKRHDWEKSIEASGFEPCLSITVRTSLDEGLRGSRPGPRWAEGYHIALLTSKRA